MHLGYRFRLRQRKLHHCELPVIRSIPFKKSAQDSYISLKHHTSLTALSSARDLPPPRLMLATAPLYFLPAFLASAASI